MPESRSSPLRRLRHALWYRPGERSADTGEWLVDPGPGWLQRGLIALGAHIRRNGFKYAGLALNAVGLWLGYQQLLAQCLDLTP